MSLKPKLNTCPRCQGRIIVDRHHHGEVSCINCGYVAYIPGNLPEDKFVLVSAANGYVPRQSDYRSVIMLDM
jgi:ribosomal protein S27AE